MKMEDSMEKSNEKSSIEANVQNLFGNMKTFDCTKFTRDLESDISALQTMEDNIE